MPVIALLISIALVAADQAIKMLVIQNVQPVGKITVIPGLFDLFYLKNFGAAFGIFQNQKLFFIITVSILTLIVIFSLFFYTRHEFFSYTASILIIGGGIGNLIDRIRLGYVVDYLSFSFFPPIFNFADCCVVVGTILLAVHLLFFGEHDSGAERVLRRR